MTNQVPQNIIEYIGDSKIYAPKGVIWGFEKPETAFGYVYHGHAIPPFRPHNMLILGYGCGTVAELTRKIWGGDVKITGVDLEFPNPPPYFEFKLICNDAFSYVLDESHSTFPTRYDYISIDLYESDNEAQCVYDERFVGCIKKLSSRLISVNSLFYNIDKLRVYYNAFDFDRQSIVSGQCVTYWRNNEQKT